MKYLIIYDNDGTIFSIQGDGYTVPKGGVQFLEVEVPLDKMIVGVDVIGKTVKLANLPKSELQIANEKIDKLEKDIADILLTIV